MNTTTNKTAIIIGAGPAGLTAAYELLNKTNIKPIIIEQTNDIGGISKTANYKGNRMDIGGHRFFSKSDTVMKWWLDILPIESEDKVDPDKNDQVMLIRNRLSRIFFLRSFFDYPIAINASTLAKLGVKRIIKIGWTYIYNRIRPIKNIETLEDFFISRFGKELYKTFFKDYTEKVWGISCKNISADWGAQRIKGLSITRALLHAIKSVFIKEKSIDQKNTDTSLIEQFMYPKFGPGQLWETVADKIEEKGGTILKNSKAVKLQVNNQSIHELTYYDQKKQTNQIIAADYYLSTMPVKDLINSIDKNVPSEVKEVANGLKYRDFITVGLLLDKMKVKSKTKQNSNNNIVPDNWIYIQERDVKVGRLQIFNNWSPYLVQDKSKIWIGLEYFCNEGDELWNMEDSQFIEFAKEELDRIDIIDKKDVVDATIIRMPKAYPAYFGTYNKFDTIRQYTDHFENLFLIGRNGMHKYNNMDHSMLSAMAAVDNIITNNKTKNAIWEVNTEEEYHEKK